jgi:hypothetical protein
MYRALKMDMQEANHPTRLFVKAPTVRFISAQGETLGIIDKATFRTLKECLITP